MFVHKHKPPAPPVYCSHGSNHLLNKQLLCLPAWVVCLYPAQGLGRSWKNASVSRVVQGCGVYNGGITNRGWGVCSYYIVTVVWRYALLICDLVEVADKITRLFGLTVKSPLAECHPCRLLLSAESGLTIAVRAASESRLSLFDWGGSGLQKAPVCR